MRIKIQNFREKLIWMFVMDLIRLKMVTSIEEVDGTIERLKESINIHFVKIDKTLESEEMRSLRKAVILCLNAIILYLNGNIATAQGLFSEVEEAADHEFHKVHTFVHKSTVTRLRIACYVFLGGYFTKSGGDMDIIRARCRQALIDLKAIDVVKHAVEGAVDGFNVFTMMMGHAEVTSILHDLGEINNVLETYLSIRVPITHPKTDAIIRWHKALKPVTLKGHEKFVETLVVSGNRLYSGSHDKTIKIWKLATNNEVHALCGLHTPPGAYAVNAIVIHISRLFEATYNRITVWDLNHNTEVACLLGHTMEIECLLLYDGRLYSGAHDNEIRYWDVNTLAPLGVIHCDAGVYRIAVHNHNLFYSVHEGFDRIRHHDHRNWYIRVLDMKTDHNEHAALAGHTGFVDALVAHNNRLYSGSKDKTIRAWDLDTMQEIGALLGHKERVCCLAVCGNKLYSGSTDKTIRIWSLATLNQERCIEVSFKVECMALYCDRVYYGENGCHDIHMIVADI